MTLVSLASLFAAMVVLAAAPSISVALVTSKAAASGFPHGAAAALGVVTGDLIFILVAASGLAFVVDAVGGVWSVLKYAAAGYLIWLSFRLWKSRPSGDGAMQAQNTSLKGSYMAGLLLTLADQKAILFYLAFLPAFIDLGELSWAGFGALAVMTVLAVGGVKLVYAYAGGRSGAMLSSAVGSKLNSVAAIALLSAAVMLIFRNG